MTGIEEGLRSGVLCWKSGRRVGRLAIVRARADSKKVQIIVSSRVSCMMSRTEKMMRIRLMAQTLTVAG